MTAAGRRGEYPECETCGAHGVVVEKQISRDEEMKEIHTEIKDVHSRVDRTITASSFYWIVGTFVAVIGSVAVLYAASMDKDLAHTKTFMSFRLDTIEGQNNRLLSKIESLTEQMSKLRDGMTDINTTIRMTDKELDALRGGDRRRRQDPGDGSP